MRAPVRFEFISEVAHQREAILAGSKALAANRKSWPNAMITIGLTTLSGLGGMALVILITTFVGLVPGWWIILGWFAGGGLYLASFQMLYSQITRSVRKSALHQVPQAISFDEAGITFEASPARWMTPWKMIDGVIETKNTLTIVVSGIVFALPKTAIGDAVMVKQLLSDLQAQIAHA